MINTVHTKKQQLENGYFSVGSGKEVILIMGSCRSVPYLNYLNLWNERNENRFTINFIDPFNWNWDKEDKFIDYISKIESLEQDERILSMLKTVKIFIHEYYRNFGMFNTFKDGKNIYEFGLSPEIDICVPNFHDVFVLFNDFVKFSPFKEEAKRHQGNLPKEMVERIGELGKNNLEKFFVLCEKSDLPEMGQYVRNNWKTKRFFWSFNHISKRFSLEAFSLMNSKFLKLPMPKSFTDEIEKHDLFENTPTPITKYDLEAYGLEWNEEVKPLKETLF